MHYIPLDSYHAMLCCHGMCCHLCLFVTCQYCTKMGKRRIMQTMPYNSPVFLVLGYQRSLRNSNGVTPKEGTK